MKRKRLAFCRKYKNLTADNWGKVIYSDQSTFRCIRSIKSRVRRAPGSDRLTASTRWKLWSIRIPWWCGIASLEMWGEGGLYFLPPKHYHELWTVLGCPGEPSHPIHEDSWSHQLPPGWGSMPYLQSHQGVSGRAAFPGHGLA
jgi:hypothetical protein